MKALWGLGHNGNLNLRVGFDEQHKDYEQFRHMLKFYVHGPCSGTGWFVSAEDTATSRSQAHGRRAYQSQGAGALPYRRRGPGIQKTRTEGRDAMRAALCEVRNRVSHALWARCELLRTAK
ncbi:hypothetical protein LTS09_003842 [Friedmanniomyces endolithicus]|nr:hypothetical protein LTS09_003842 [Friedmanniomyces endolithicus]